MKKRTKVAIGASGGVEASAGASLLPALNPRTMPWPASSSCSQVELVGRLTQGLCQAENLRAIAIRI